MKAAENKNQTFFQLKLVLELLRKLLGAIFGEILKNARASFLRRKSMTQKQKFLVIVWNPLYPKPGDIR